MESKEFKHAIEFPILRELKKRDLTIRGWCFNSSGEPLRGIRARIGDRVFVGKRKQARPLIGQRFPEFEEAARSGFRIEVELPKGKSEVVIECKDQEKVWHEIEKLTIRTPRFSWPWSKDDDAHDYAAWVERYDTLDKNLEKRAKEEIESFPEKPLFSVLLPVYNTPEKWLRRALDSALEQWYPHWELCIADDASTVPHVAKVLKEYADRDRRIQVKKREANGHIVAATNTALEMASGDYVALFDHDDELRPNALFEMARELIKHPDTALLFSDEDHLDEQGRRCQPYFKPDFNYELLLSQNCICHLGVYQTELVRAVGGFRPGTEGAQDWDLALRVIETCGHDRVRHLPRMLYHWRNIEGSTARNVDEKPYALEAGRGVVESHLQRTRQSFDEVLLTEQGRCRVKWALPDPAPAVTIVIPTRNFGHLLKLCIATVLEKTEYPDFEILIVDNDSDEEETLNYLGEISQQPRIDVLRVPGPFNYSKLNNLAVDHSRNPVVCLLNNDIEILDGGWLREMVSQAIRDEVGAVGAKLHFPDGRIQHAGVILGAVGGAGHFCKLMAPEDPVAREHATMTRNFCAVTAACLVVEKTKYQGVGGMDEQVFAVAYNDVDFCLKLREAGFRNVWTPFAKLLHHESASRAEAERTQAGYKRAMGETIALDAKWHELLSDDPAYNPNLTLDAEDADLAFPPRQRGRMFADESED